MIFFLFFFDDDEGHNSIDDNDDDAFLVVEMTNSFLFNFNFKLHFLQSNLQIAIKKNGPFWPVFIAMSASTTLKEIKKNKEIKK